MRRKVGKSSWERFLESKHGSILDPQDTISRMPETVLHHMMSFLPPSDRNQVSFLSRKWRRLGAQVQTDLWLTRHRLNEVEFSKILNDDFHSVEFLFLTKCPGMRNLKLVNFKLEAVYLNYCGSLKNVYLNTPNLDTLYFHGPRVRPCVFEFNNCKSLRVLHLVGVAMNTMMFINCNESFPVLQILSLGGCDMSGSINISSNSIRNLALMRFKNPVGVTIDAPNLGFFRYNGSTILPFQNISFPSLARAKIELTPCRYQKRDDIWFTRLIEMLHFLKHAETLEFYTNSEKNIIIPKKLRESLVPPLDDIMCLVVNTNSRLTNIVDLADSMLWVSPRLKNLVCRSGFGMFVLQLTHRELLPGTPDDPCSFCTSHPSRCWQHLVIEYALNYSCDKWKKKMMPYIQVNLKKARRNAIDWSVLELELM